MPESSELQEGIYYSHSDYPRNSFAIVFLRVEQPSEASLLMRTMSGLWQMYSRLKRGLVSGLNVREKDPYLGKLSVLVGYGPSLFGIAGINRMKPELLSDQLLFSSSFHRGAPVFPGIGLRYADDVIRNEIADDHIVIQFIADTQLATHRAVVETWKYLTGFNEDKSPSPVTMRAFYTGFNRPDGRNWLGFHDGLANIKGADRLNVIQIDRKSLKPRDYWTANGTYLAFIRIAIDLNIWETIPGKEQEKIVGRQKGTGCPLVGTDKLGNNLFARGCPVPGTHQVTERGNERYREYQSVHKGIRHAPDVGVEGGHVQLMRSTPDQIFRQGYEFLEPTEVYPYFRVGLNFISFQGSTERINRSIRYGFRRGSFGGQTVPGIDRLMSVLAAGLFFVPPVRRGQEFPGDLIFQ